MENKKGTAANREGLGSTYAGTQTPDPHAPDGYQTPKSGNDNPQAGKVNKDKKGLEVKQQDLPDQQPLGSEYKEDDSYGNKLPMNKKSKKNNDGKEPGEGTPA